MAKKVETEDTPTQPSTSTQPLPRARTGGGDVGRVLLRILGWLFAMAMGVVLGILAYILVPPIYQQLIAPVQANTADITELQGHLTELEARLAGLDAQQASIAVEQDEALLTFREEQAERSTLVEGRLADAEARLNDSEQAQDDLEEELAALDAALDEQTATMGGLEARLTTLEEEIPGAEELAELNRQLLLLRGWQEVLKARVRLVQNNAGAAYEELLLAQVTLELAYQASQPEDREELEPVLERLADVLVELEINPFAATEDLEIVWHDLDRLINPEVSLSEEFPEEAPTEATPAPTPTTTPSP